MAIETSHFNLMDRLECGGKDELVKKCDKKSKTSRIFEW